MTAQTIRIGHRMIGAGCPTYFVADIGANHDGDFGRARELIHLAAAAGADAAKFQHFAASTIVSDRGFRDLGSQLSHQSHWNKSVFDVYASASLDPSWTMGLSETCREAGIDFFTSPYAVRIVDEVDPYVSAFKVGSGDITWHEIIRFIATKDKPVLLATGASTLEEVRAAVDIILSETAQLVLMQCNTNYTGSLENLKHVNLNVLNLYRALYPDMVLGLSDHTPGPSSVLGAVAIGARVIEKHFTDDTTRDGPDHSFSMTPDSWREMVDRTHELEEALGEPIKKIEDNERETAILQRRAIRMVQDLSEGTRLERSDLVPLRPCPSDAISPAELDRVVGAVLRRSMEAGEYLRWNDLS